MDKDPAIYKYALALSSLAKEEKQLDRVNQNLSSLNKLFREEDNLFNFLKHPGVPREEKFEVVENLAKELKLSSVTKDFVKFLMVEKKIGDLEDIVDRYQLILRAINKEIKVVVESACLRDKKVLEEIRDVLSKKFKAKIMLDFKENKDLIGGFRVIADGEVFDASIKAELKDLEKSLG